jgi:hypothetical protein
MPVNNLLLTRGPRRPLEGISFAHGLLSSNCTRGYGRFSFVRPQYFGNKRRRENIGISSEVIEKPDEITWIASS